MSGQELPPSKVVHIRHVDPEANKQDIQTLCSAFGNVTRVVLTRSKNQALVQFSDLQSAVTFVQRSITQPIVIRNQTAIAQYSSYQDLAGEDRPGRPRPDQDAVVPNSIILVTITNPMYTINVDVINQVFSPFGVILKLIIFQKNTDLQVLLQYQEIDNAIQAQRSLNGLNIYPNCCLLQIHFSNLQELSVRFNNDRSRDFTNPYLPNGNESQDRERNRSFNPTRMPAPAANFYNPAPFYSQPFGYGNGGGRCVIDVGNLSPDVSCDHIFNLFSNYGNVIKIKLMHRKPDHALVQMNDSTQANNVMTYLKGVPVHNRHLELSLTKFPSIQLSPGEGGDRGKDYTSSPLNRFSNPQAAQRNAKRLCLPSHILHISNLAVVVKPEDLHRILAAHGVVQDIKIFDHETKRQAFVQMADIPSSVNVMINLNGLEISGRAIRLSFSSRVSIQSTPLASSATGGASSSSGSAPSRPSDPFSVPI